MRLATLAAATLAAACVIGCSTAGSVATTPRAAQTAESAALQVSKIATDTPTRTCAAQDRLAAFSLATGPAFWAAFPKAGTAPELDNVSTPLVAVVYANGWPGVVLGVPGAEKSTPAPGTYDVCVETADGSKAIGGQSFIVYGNIPAAESVVANP